MVISFANNKGGVGKTTLAYNTGGILATLGYKVLMVDMDGQCSLTNLTKQVISVLNSVKKNTNY